MQVCADWYRLGKRFVAVVCFASFLSLLALHPAKTPRERTVVFTYRAIIPPASTGSKPTEVWMPVPHDSPFQHITGLTIQAPVPYRLKTGTYGNRILQLSLPPGTTDSVVVTMQFTARRLEHTQATERSAVGPSLAPAERTRWLQPDRLVPLDSTIRSWAQAVVVAAKARTDLDKARAIYNHVINTVKYDKSGTGWGRGDIYYACDARRGNCTDFHAVFIGYCRAVGIPARFAIGVSLPTDRPSGQISGYHCWAEFYLDQVGWVPIDASEAAKNPAKRAYFFGTHDENRIEFSVGRDLQLYPKQTEPLNFFVYPYAETAGQSVTGVRSVFTYRQAS